MVVPQEGYLSKVKALCKRYNILLIADEVQTGLGRSVVERRHQMMHAGRKETGT